jgi:dolichol-phosphate mannosyltransferase
LDSRPSLYVVVPVLNEHENVPKLIHAFRTIQIEHEAKFRAQILMVDDGSTDGTAAKARNLASGINFLILSHERNLGPGYAFGTAFEYLSPHVHEQDVIATIEGDNTSRHELLGKMLRRLDEDYDVILASPYMYGGGITKTSSSRIFLSHAGNSFVKQMLGIRGILTMSSFYRVYRGSLIRKLQQVYGPRILERRGFESMIELLLKMICLNARISEVPMVLDTSRRAGRSKMKIVPTIAGYITLWKDKNRWKQMAR